MELDDLNGKILDVYKSLAEENKVDLEMVVKSAACVAILIFDSAGVDNVSIDDKKLVMLTK